MIVPYITVLLRLIQGPWGGLFGIVKPRAQGAQSKLKQSLKWRRGGIRQACDAVERSFDNRSFDGEAAKKHRGGN